VPVGVLVPLRKQFAAARPDTWRHRALGGVLEVVRHRGIPAGEQTFALPDRPSVRFVRADSLVLQRAYWMGTDGWEPDLAMWWPVLCSEATGVLELGANVGYYTVQGALAAPQTPYRAVEAHPETAAVLRRNLELNHCAHVEVIEGAAVPTDVPGPVQLVVPDTDHFATPAGALVEGRSEIRRAGAVALSVPAVPVASLVDGVDLVKLDVEGQEHELLRALWPCLMEHRPTLCVELLRGTPKLRELLIELCEQGGYSILAPSRERLRAIPLDRLRQVALDDFLETRDLIFTTSPALRRRAGSPTAG
jgi:FkbM family methyltransferase